MKRPKEDLNNRSNTKDTSTNCTLLHLMQIHDSAFPVGSYTHSFGMETYIQKDIIKTKQDLFQFCKTYLHHSLACGDAILVKEAFTLVNKRDWDGLVRLDSICHAMKLASESRNGSMMIGRQFLKTVLPLQSFQELEHWDLQMKHSKVNGHFCIIYGIYAALMGFPLETTVSTFLYSSVTSLIHNAVRAVPFGQNTGVSVIYELLPSIDAAAKDVLNRTMDDISNRSIGIEISSMQHQFLYSRLFIS